MGSARCAASGAGSSRKHAGSPQLYSLANQTGGPITFPRFHPKIAMRAWAACAFSASHVTPWVSAALVVVVDDRGAAKRSNEATYPTAVLLLPAQEKRPGPAVDFCLLLLLLGSAQTTPDPHLQQVELAPFTTSKRGHEYSKMNWFVVAIHAHHVCCPVRWCGVARVRCTSSSPRGRYQSGGYAQQKRTRLENTPQGKRRRDINPNPHRRSCYETYFRQNEAGSGWALGRKGRWTGLIDSKRWPT